MNPVDMSDVADMIIGQSHVGCVIKQVGPDTSGTAGDPADEAEDRLGTNDRLGTEAEEADDTVYGVRGTSTPFVGFSTMLLFFPASSFKLPPPALAMWHLLSHRLSQHLCQMRVNLVLAIRS